MLLEHPIERNQKISKVEKTPLEHYLNKWLMDSSPTNTLNSLESSVFQNMEIFSLVPPRYSTPSIITKGYQYTWATPKTPYTIACDHQMKHINKTVLNPRAKIEKLVKLKPR